MFFTGFSDKASEFLENVAANNSKEWYHSHKEDYYRFVRDPFYDLVTDLTPVVREIDPKIITEPKSCLSRIYRDTRFSKNKSLYRNTAWICFRQPYEDYLKVPSFFVELSPRVCRYGMGSYEIGAKTMRALRNDIQADPDSFRLCISEIESDPDLFISGEEYRRTPSGCPEGLEKWFSLKYFYICSSDIPISGTRSGFSDYIAVQFKKMALLYAELVKVEMQRVLDENTSEKKRMVREQFEW